MVDPFSIASLTYTIIEGLLFLAKRGKRIYKDYKNVPRRARHLVGDIDAWHDLIDEVRDELITNGELLDGAVRTQLSAYLHDIDDLIKKAHRLINAHEKGEYLKEDDFIDLEEEFQEERARLHIWLELAHLKITRRSRAKIDIIGNDTAETRKTVRKIWKHVKRLQAQSEAGGLVLRPDFNQSLTDLGQLAESELDETHTQQSGAGKGKMKDIPAVHATDSNDPNGLERRIPTVVYVDTGTQTEPPRPVEQKQATPPLSHTLREIDPDDLPSPSGFPLWVNGVPTTVGGSSLQMDEKKPPRIRKGPRRPTRKELELAMAMLEIWPFENVLSESKEAEQELKTALEIL